MTLEHVFKEITVSADQYGPSFNQSLSPRTARSDECHKNVKAYQRNSGQQSPRQRLLFPTQPIRDGLAQQHHNQEVKGGELADRAMARNSHKDQ
ncbi:hypothetical protein D3C71_2045280 [compost metagenome]